MKTGLYENPKYYEIAFSFRNIAAEVETMLECSRRYSTLSPKRFFEIGCGNSPHMEELIARGFEYTGIDLSADMLEYSRQRASKAKITPELIQANMTEFSIGRKVDFAFVMLGSIYASSTRELASHFDSVSHALNPGGLYLLDWCIQFDPLAEHSESFETMFEGIRVVTHYTTRPLNRIEQTYEEHIVLDITEEGRTRTVETRDLKRGLYPQEFLSLIAGRKDFEFVGWWNNWNLSRPLQGTEKIERPITLIRRI